jgi:hypothetical protein
MMSPALSPNRFMAWRRLPGVGGEVVEAVVRVGQLEARALVPAGAPLVSWTVRRAGRWSREGVGLEDLRRGRLHRGRSLAGACAALAREVERAVG